MATTHGEAGMALGLMRGKMFSQRLQRQVLHLQPGDRIVQYTDGIDESVDEHGQPYIARIAGSVLSNATHSF